MTCDNQQLGYCNQKTYTNRQLLNNYQNTASIRNQSTFNTSQIPDGYQSSQNMSNQTANYNYRLIRIPGQLPDYCNHRPTSNTNQSPVHCNYQSAPNNMSQISDRYRPERNTTQLTANYNYHQPSVNPNYESAHNTSQQYAHFNYQSRSYTSQPLYNLDNQAARNITQLPVIDNYQSQPNTNQVIGDYNDENLFNSFQGYDNNTIIQQVSPTDLYQNKCNNTHSASSDTFSNPEVTNDCSKPTFSASDSSNNTLLFSIKEKSLEYSFLDSDILKEMAQICGMIVSRRSFKYLFNLFDNKIVERDLSHGRMQKLMKSAYSIIVWKKLRSILTKINSIEKTNDYLNSSLFKSELKSFRMLTEDEAPILNSKDLNDLVLKHLDNFNNSDNKLSNTDYVADNLLNYNQFAVDYKDFVAPSISSRITPTYAQKLFILIYEFTEYFYWNYFKPYPNLENEFIEFVLKTNQISQTCLNFSKQERLFYVFFHLIATNFPSNTFLTFYSKNVQGKKIIPNELKKLDKLILFLFHLDKMRVNYPFSFRNPKVFELLHNSIEMNSNLKCLE